MNKVWDAVATTQSYLVEVMVADIVYRFFYECNNQENKER